MDELRQALIDMGGSPEGVDALLAAHAKLTPEQIAAHNARVAAHNARRAQARMDETRQALRALGFPEWTIVTVLVARPDLTPEGVSELWTRVKARAQSRHESLMQESLASLLDRALPGSR